MNASEIELGGKYIAKINGRLTICQVIDIRPRALTGRDCYHVTNLKTGRATVFHSAARFRSKV